MKKITIMLLSILLLAGCTTIDISKMESYEIIEEILSKNVEMYNNSFEGYKLYIPQGLKVIDKNNNNIKIYGNKETLYLYIDTVSYYYKEKQEFKEISSYMLSKSIEYNGKKGYINVSEKDDKYLLEMVYNYSKVEALVSKQNLNTVILNASYILSSIKYNDKVISLFVNENISSYKEEKINIFETDDENNSLLESIDKYDDNENFEDDQNTIKDDQDILDYTELE